MISGRRSTPKGVILLRLDGINESSTRSKGDMLKMKDAQYARDVLKEMEQQVKSLAKRKRMAAFFATNPAGKLSPEAVAVYKAYAA